MKGFKVLAPLVMLVLLSVAPIEPLMSREEALNGTIVEFGNTLYADGQLLCADGTVLRFTSQPGFSIKPHEPSPDAPPDSLMFYSERYSDLLKKGKLGPIKNAPMTVKGTHIATGETFTLILIEPQLIRVDIPIGGTLNPGIGHGYGPYSSCVNIAVSVTWTPGDQILGIGIEEVGTGTVSVRWFTGGSAWTQFYTDWTKSYRIWIISHWINTRTITYNGTITLYMW